MKLSEGEGGNTDDHVDAVHPSLVNSQDNNGIAATEKGSSVTDPEATSNSPQQAQTVGAPPIRWRWWAVGLVVSLGIWFALFRLFGLV